MSVGDTTVPGTHWKLVNTFKCMFKDVLILISSGKGPRAGDAAETVSIHPFIHLVFQWIQWGRAVHSAPSEFNQLLRVSCITLEKSSPLCVRNSVEMGNRQVTHSVTQEGRQDAFRPLSFLMFPFWANSASPKFLGWGSSCPQGRSSSGERSCILRGSWVRP